MGKGKTFKLSERFKKRTRKNAAAQKIKDVYPEQAGAAQRLQRAVEQKVDRESRLIDEERLVERHPYVMGMERYDDVHEMLAGGMPATRVADLIQERWGDAEDISRTALIRKLRRYYKDIPDAEKHRSTVPRRHAEAVDKHEQQLSVLDELQWLYEKQKKRLNLWTKYEIDGGMLMPNTPREINETRRTLESIAKLRQELGIDTRHLGRLEVAAEVAHVDTARRVFGQEVAQVLEDPQSSYRVHKVAERMMSLVRRGTEQQVIDVEAEE